MIAERDDNDGEPLGASELDRMRRARRERARYLRSQILNRLWAGNAGGAVTTLAAMGTLAEKGSSVPATILFPLGFFVAGLVVLGAGAIIAISVLIPEIRNLEDSDTILGAKSDRATRPSERDGLSWRNPETVAGLIAAFAFTAGVITGFIALLIELVPHS